MLNKIIMLIGVFCISVLLGLYLLLIHWSHRRRSGARPRRGVIGDVALVHLVAELRRRRRRDRHSRLEADHRGRGIDGDSLEETRGVMMMLMVLRRGDSMWRGNVSRFVIIGDLRFDELC